MALEENIQEYIDSIKKSLDYTQKPVKRKVQSIFKALKKTKKDKEFINLFTEKLEENKITSSPVIEHNLPLSSFVEFNIKGEGTIPAEKPMEPPRPKVEDQPKISIPDDLFLNLFDFEDNLEYERFQSALDSYLPVGLFLIPQKEDFFSDVIEQILSLEIIRKRDYTGTDFYPNSVAYLDIELVKSDDLNDNDRAIASDIWKDAHIYHFNSSTMNNVILGKTGMQLLQSEKFSKDINKLLFHSNKNSKEQIFIIFHCPSMESILKGNRLDVLERTIEFISKKLPNVFRLQCKYPTENAIDAPKKLDVFKHLRLLSEMPSYSIDPELSLSDYLSELNKVRYQIESQMLFQMENEYLSPLRWDSELNEDTYLKYLTYRTLRTHYNYSENEVMCANIASQTLTDFFNGEYVDTTFMPKLLATKEIAIEIETLKGAQFDRNVYLSLISNIENKVSYWMDPLKNEVKELWFVFTGFEISRNYYQIKKLIQVISSKLNRHLKRDITIKVFAPDYYNRTILPVDLGNVYEPILSIRPVENKKKVEITTIYKNEEFNFKDVIGLNEEKETLLNLKKLQDDNSRLGIGGILFYGLPGCGKTYLSQAFASEINRNFFNFSPAEVISMWIGQSSKNIRTVFSQARSKSPALLFMDELDSFGFSRDAISSGQAHSDQGATINQLLVELNNLDEEDVLVIGATNRLSALDIALKRSGRFDLKIPIFPPDQEERKDMFHYYLQKVNKELSNKGRDVIEVNNLLLSTLGEESRGFTSSDIRTVCNMVRIDALLRKPNYQSTDAVLGKVYKFINEGMRTLRQRDVEHFIKECQENDSNSKKLAVLADEWLR